MTRRTRGRPKGSSRYSVEDRETLAKAAHYRVTTSMPLTTILRTKLGVTDESKQRRLRRNWREHGPALIEAETRKRAAVYALPKPMIDAQTMEALKTIRFQIGDGSVQRDWAAAHQRMTSLFDDLRRAGTSFQQLMDTMRQTFVHAERAGLMAGFIRLTHQA